MPIIRNKQRKALFLVAVWLIIFHRSISSSILPEGTVLTDLPPVKEMGAIGEVASKEDGLVNIKENLALAHSVEKQSGNPQNEFGYANDHRAAELDKIVQSITTVTQFTGGQEERNRGSGFVVGNHFFTVHHNLTTSFPSLRVKSTSFIDGMSVTEPILSSREHDVAVFELPEKLCARHCNNTEVTYLPELNLSRKVYWLRKFGEDFILKEAMVLGSVSFGDVDQPAGLSCDEHSVVLVDQPFIAGSSGSPIMDAKSGKIIGVIQGSVGEDEDVRGYFKSINCVLAMLENSRSTQSTAGL